MPGHATTEHVYVQKEEKAMMAAGDDISRIIRCDVVMVRCGTAMKIPDDTHVSLCEELAKDPTEF